MYKVLFVDDEALIREAITENIPWKTLGYQLTGACRNGKEAMDRIRQDPPDLLLTAWEEERALPLSRAIADFAAHHGRPGRVAVVIGPEGGIAAEEWEALRALGAVSVTLGPRILRTETAGLCALSVLWAALGEM